MEIIIWLVMGFFVSSIIMTIFPSVRAWIDGGSKGVKDYKKRRPYWAIIESIQISIEISRF